MSPVFLFSAKWQLDGLKRAWCTSNKLVVQDWINKSLTTLEEAQVDFGFVTVLPSDDIVVITDRYATVPVFVAFQNGVWYFSDYVASIKKRISTTWNQSAISEQLYFDYIISPRKTIYNEIQKIESGVKVWLKANGEIEVVERMSTVLPRNRKGQSLNREAIKSVQNEILKSVEGYQNLYIPLSGGLDSRLIAGVISTSHSHKIWSRTYGDPNSLDVKIGTRVAQTLGINHSKVSKSNQQAIHEFETMVHESSGLLNGVHAHDLEGRNWFEQNTELKAKVSGFIGDVFARGTNMREKEKSKEVLTISFMNKWSNHLLYDYDRLLNKSTESQIANVVSRFIDDEAETESIHWRFYQQVRIPNMVSLLEYHSTLTKPNIKPFVVPKVREIISEYAGRDEWDGMNYVEIAKTLIPNIINIPFASNSVFYSKSSQLIFRLRKKMYRSFANAIAKYSKGKIQPLPFNATLNWRRILAEENEWVISSVSNAANTFDFDYSYLMEIYNEHRSGKKDHQELLMRVINLGVLVSK